MRVLRWDRYARAHKDGLPFSTWEQEMEEAGWSGSVVYLDVDDVPLPQWAGEALDWEGRGGVVRCRVRVAAPRRADGSVDEVLRRPLELFTSFIPSWVADRAPEVRTFGSPRHGGSYYSIQDQGGVRLWPIYSDDGRLVAEGGRYRRRVIIGRSSTEEETKALGLSRPEPVTVEERTIWSAPEQEDPEVANRPVTVDRCVSVGTLTFLDDFPLT
jgi:hypothetical protein